MAKTGPVEPSAPMLSYKIPTQKSLSFKSLVSAKNKNTLINQQQQSKSAVFSHRCFQANLKVYLFIWPRWARPWRIWPSDRRLLHTSGRRRNLTEIQNKLRFI